MIKEDYILKIIRRVVEFIAKALGLAKEGDFLTSEKVLENGLQDLTGLSLETMITMDTESIKAVAGGKESLVYILAEFLKGLAEVEKIRSNLDLCYIYSKKALSLYLGIRDSDDYETLEPITNIYKEVKSTVYEKDLTDQLIEFFNESDNEGEIEFLTSIE